MPREVQEGDGGRGQGKVSGDSQRGIRGGFNWGLGWGSSWGEDVHLNCVQREDLPEPERETRELDAQASQSLGKVVEEVIEELCLGNPHVPDEEWSAAKKTARPVQRRGAEDVLSPTTFDVLSEEDFPPLKSDLEGYEPWLDPSSHQ